MKHTLNIFLLFVLLESSAQNLVPNASFETYTSLPTGAPGFPVTDWYVAGGTPDYFHAWASGSQATPATWAGDVNPHTGNAVAGMLTKSGAPSGEDYREYLGVQLSAPTTVGATYELSYWITNGEDNYYGGQSSDHIGVDLSTNTYGSGGNAPLNFTPMFDIPNQLWTSNWQQISYTFVADNAYKYLTFGNYYPDSLTTSIIQASYSYTYPSAYYFFDDFDLHCLNCETSIEEIVPIQKEIVRIIDLMGKEAEDKPNTILIYIYSDGSTEKVYRME